MSTRSMVEPRKAPVKHPEICYLYGVMSPESGVHHSLPDRGIANRELRFLSYKDIAAVISPVEGSSLIKRGGAQLARNLRSHSAVLTRIAERNTILPAGFGVELECAELEYWLSDQYESLRAELDRLDGKVELKVRAAYTEEGAVRRVFEDNPALEKEGHAARGMNDRVAFGKRMAGAVRQMAIEDGRKFFKRLAPVAEKAVEYEPGERGLLSVSLLVERERVEEVDSILRAIDGERGDVLEISCIGPLPPYSFVTPLWEKTGGCHGIA